MSKTKAFETYLRDVLGRTNVPENIAQKLVTLSQEHAGKAALGAGALGTAGGAGAGYMYGKHKGKQNLTIQDIVNSLQGKVGLGKNSADANPRQKHKEGAAVHTTTKRATDFLTAEERARCLHTGALMKCANAGMDKQAIFESVGSIFDAGTKAVVVASIVTGIPVGIMSHLMSKATKGNRMKEQELQSKANFYRNAGQQLERNLSNQGVRL